MMPLVSICIPIYNGSLYLNEALKSVESQSYPKCEVIISDDNSIDDSLEIASLHKERCKFPVRIVTNKLNNRGIGNNWNNCIIHARGEYIKFIFQDDILREDCIDKMMYQIELYPTVGFVYCKRNFMYPKGDLYYINWVMKFGDLHKHWFNEYQLNSVIKGSKFLKDRNLFSHPHNKFGEPIATLIKKEIFTQIGLFNTQLKQTLDYEYWNRLLGVTDTIFIDEPLVTFRLHNKQTSRINEIEKLNESDLYYESMYKTLLFRLHLINVWFLLQRFHPIISTLNKIFKKVKKRLRYSYLKIWVQRKIGF
jgi:glycosyltransferase involved in cell wall biosynthesis